MGKAKVIRFHKTGDLNNLQFDMINIVDPIEDEVQFKVEAFALNQADVLFLQGKHYTQPVFPSRIGSEATGIVTAIGSKVNQFKVGDRVTSIPFYTTKYGVQGEYATVPENYLTKIPNGYSLEEATSFWMQFLTAYYGLFNLGNAKKGDFIYLPAASGSAGQAFIKLAKHIGANVITSTRSNSKKEFLKELGADYVIVSEKEDIATQLKAITKGKGVNLVFDPISGEFYHNYINQLAHQANVVIYGALSGSFNNYPVLELIRNHATMHAYSMFNYVNNKRNLEIGKKYVIEHIEKGHLKPVVDKVFNFDDTIAAYQYMLSNKQQGKIVITI